MPTTPRTDLLACPRCHGPLETSAEALSCGPCGVRYPVVEGIPCFAPSEEFYDAYALEHCPFHLSPRGLKGWILPWLPFWSWREWRFWKRAVPRCETLLDIGCGSGRELFAQRAKVSVGFDGGLQFARNCSQHYTSVAVGQLPRLPFKDGAFDVVVSSHVIGHIAAEHKDTLAAEIARVLRPGGVTAHVIETDSTHPIVAEAKRRPAAYRAQFVDQDGHIGLEPASVAIGRFERQGLRLSQRRLVDAILPSALNYRKYLSHPEFAGIPGVARLKRMDEWQAGNPLANAFYEVSMGLFHQTVEQWKGDPERAQFILVQFEKPGRA